VEEAMRAVQAREAEVEAQVAAAAARADAAEEEMKRLRCAHRLALALCSEHSFLDQLMLWDILVLVACRKGCADEVAPCASGEW
jgi:hypothetical protein